MSTTTDLTTLKINYLTQAQYDAEVSGGTIDENAIYMTPTDSLADYVVEQNISGEWVYRKWSSGKVEAWAQHDFGNTTGTLWSSANGIYYADKTLTIPSDLFDVTPLVFASSANQSWSPYGTSISGTTLTCRVIRPASNAANLTMNFYAVTLTI